MNPDGSALVRPEEPGVTVPSAKHPANRRLSPGGPDVSKLRPRFGLAYLLLAAVLGGSIAGLVVYLQHRPGASVAWSSWKPSLHGEAAWKQIADHVAPRYRVPSGKQIVGVVANAAEVQATQTTKLPITVALISSGLPDERLSDIKVVQINDGAMYGLCGLGSNCSIPGTPSNTRMDVLRRESLELALLTFKYDSSVDTVFTVLPAPLGTTAQRTIFFQRGDLSSQLSTPLKDTLNPDVKVSPTKLPKDERPTIMRLTAPHFYNYSYRSAPDGSVAMILTPATA